MNYEIIYVFKVLGPMLIEKAEKTIAILKKWQIFELLNKNNESTTMAIINNIWSSFSLLTKILADFISGVYLLN